MSEAVTKQNHRQDEQPILFYKGLEISKKLGVNASVFLISLDHFLNNTPKHRNIRVALSKDDLILKFPFGILMK